MLNKMQQQKRYNYLLMLLLNVQLLRLDHSSMKFCNLIGQLETLQVF